MHEFNAEPALLAFRDLVATAPYLSAVAIGAPEAIGSQLTAWVSLGGPGYFEVSRQGSIHEITIELHCSLGYFLQGNETTAELMLGRYVPDMLARLARNGFEDVDGVGRNLNGTCAGMERPCALQGVETYALRMGSEIRVYTISVLVTLTPGQE